MSDSDGYIPGACNIGAAEIRLRRRIGWIALATTVVAGAILILLQLLTVGAALQDGWRLRISNLFPIVIIACFVAWVAVIGPEFDLWQNLVAFLLCL